MKKIHPCQKVKRGAGNPRGAAIPMVSGLIWISCTGRNGACHRALVNEELHFIRKAFEDISFSFEARIRCFIIHLCQSSLVWRRFTARAFVGVLSMNAAFLCRFYVRAGNFHGEVICPAWDAKETCKGVRDGSGLCRSMRCICGADLPVHRRLCPPGRQGMSAFYLIGAAVSVALLVYLIYALLKPENF
jgi:K+-transporting ATPase KdpF subunit